MQANWIHPPKFDDDRLDYVARIIHASLLSIAALGAVTWALQSYLVPAATLRFAIIYLSVATVTMVLLGVNRSRPVFAGAVALVLIWLIVTASIATSGGVHAPARFAYFPLIIICTLAFSLRASLALLAATIAATLAMVWMETEGLLPPVAVVHTSASTSVLLCYGYLIAFVVVAAASRATWSFLERNRAAKASLQQANDSLDELVKKLNARVGQLEFVHQSAGLVSWVWDVAADRMEWFGDREALMGLASLQEFRTFQDYVSLLHPDDRENSWRNLRDCLKGLHQHYRAQERVLTADGGVRWLEVMGRRDAGADGRTVRMAGVMRDITEERQAHEAVTRSERRFRGLFDSALDGIAILSPDGSLIDANPTCCHETGFTYGELIGRPFSAFFPQGDAPEPWVQFGRIEKEGSVRSEGRVRRKDGTLIPVEIHAWRLPDGNVQAIMRDIRERKRADERFAKIFRVGPGAITLSRMSDGKYLDVNDEWHRWSGYSRGETIGRTAVEIDVWPDPAERARLVAAVRRNGSVRNFETRLRRKSGDIADIIMGVELLELDGEPHLAISIDDVTERKRAAVEIARLNTTLEARVRDRTAELEQANSDLESFSYSISHDLQAPLRRILGFAQMLERSHAGSLRGEGLRLLERVAHNARRMNALIEDLLAFFKIAKGQPAQRRLVDMHGEVANLIEELELQDRVELRDLPNAEGDPSMLRQVWQNLILNAAKFSRDADRPRVVIRGERLADGRVEYTVEDNGVGFDMTRVDKLFGVFQRLHSEREFEGTGVGLAIVQRIVGRHGGIVRAYSEPGKGARFSFTLPDAVPGKTQGEESLYPPQRVHA